MGFAYINKKIDCMLQHYTCLLSHAVKYGEVLPHNFHSSGIATICRVWLSDTRGRPGSGEQ